MHNSFFLGLTLLLWVLLELSLFLRNRYRFKEKKDPSAITLIVFSFLSAIGVSVYAILFEVGFMNHLTVTLQIIGGLLFLSGVSFRLYLFFYTGSHFTQNVSMSRYKNKRYMKGVGIYSYIRYPIFTSLLLITTSIGLISFNYIVMFYCFIVVPVTYVYFIFIEEKRRNQSFYGTYQQYKKKTWVILPFIY